MSKIERFLSDPRYQALDDAGKKEKLDLFFNKYVTQDARYAPLDEDGKARVYSKFMSKYYGEPEAKAPKQKTPFSGLKSELKGTMSLTQSAEAISTGLAETQTLDRREKAYQKVMADREEALRIIDRERNLKQAIPQDRVAAGQQYIKKVESIQGAPKYPIKSQYTAAMERLQPNNYTDPTERQVAHEIVNKEKLDKAQREYQRIAERTASATPEERKEIAKSLAAQQTLIDYYATGMTAAERAAYQAGQEGSESFRMVKALGAGSIDLASSVYQLFNPDSKFARTINAYSAGLLEQSDNQLEDAFAQVFYSMPMTLGYFMTRGILGAAGTGTKAAAIATKAGEVASLMHSVNINAYMTAKKHSDAISGYGSATAVPEGVFLAGSTAALVESAIEMLSDTAQAKIVLGQAKRVGRRGAEQIIKNSLRGKIAGYGTRLATGTAESAITEFTEEILQGASGMIFDVMSNQREVPSLEEAFKELMYSGAVGALGGITFGLGGGIMVQSSNYQNWREVKKQAASGNEHAARLWEARSILDKSNPNGEVWKSDVQRAYDVIKSDLHAVTENRYQEDNPSIAQAMAQMYDAYAMVDMIKSPQQEAVREAMQAGVQRILDQKRATAIQEPTQQAAEIEPQSVEDTIVNLVQEGNIEAAENALNEAVKNRVTGINVPYLRTLVNESKADAERIAKEEADQKARREIIDAYGEYANMSHSELQDEAKKRGLKAGGKSTDIMARLKESDEKPKAETAPAKPAAKKPLTTNEPIEQQQDRAIKESLIAEETPKKASKYESMGYNALQKEAKKRGINSFGVKKAELIRQLEEKASDTEKAKAERAAVKPKLVKTEWMSKLEDVPHKIEGSIVARRSDWDKSLVSELSGREIVHVYWIDKGDGEAKPYGIQSAAKIMGWSKAETDRKIRQLVNEHKAKEANIKAWRSEAREYKGAASPRAALLTWEPLQAHKEQDFWAAIDRDFVFAHKDNTYRAIPKNQSEHIEAYRMEGWDIQSTDQASQDTAPVKADKYSEAKLRKIDQIYRRIRTTKDNQNIQDAYMLKRDLGLLLMPTVGIEEVVSVANHYIALREGKATQAEYDNYIDELIAENKVYDTSDAEKAAARERVDAYRNKKAEDSKAEGVEIDSNFDAADIEAGDARRNLPEVVVRRINTAWTENEKLTKDNKSKFRELWVSHGTNIEAYLDAMSRRGFTGKEQQAIIRWLNEARRLRMESEKRRDGYSAKAAEDIGSEVMSRSNFQEQYRQAQEGKLPKEQIDAQLKLYDAMMDTYAKEMGITIDEAYAEVIDSVTADEPVDGTGAFDPSNPDTLFQGEVTSGAAIESTVIPKKIVSAYRIGYLNPDGTVSPVMVDNKTTRQSYKMGTWYDAETRKSSMAVIPGFHFAYTPSLPQLYKEDGTLDPQRVYYIAEYDATNNYQSEADASGEGFIRGKIPENGFYFRKKRGIKGWVISGKMRPVRVLTMQEVDEINRQNGIETINGMPIEMYKAKQAKYKAKKGIREQNLQQLTRGYIQQMPNGKYRIGIMQPNVTTGLHEQAHLGKSLMEIMANKSPAWASRLKAAEEWCGVKDGNWTTEAEEKFANGYVKFLADGSAPNSKLKTIFAKIKEWIGSILQGLADVKNLDVSNEMRGVYLSMLGISEGKRNLTSEQKVQSIKLKSAMKQDATSDPLKLETEIDSFADSNDLILEGKRTGNKTSFYLNRIDDGKTMIEIHHSKGEYEVNGYHAANNQEVMEQITRMVGDTRFQTTDMPSAAEIAEAERQMADVRNKYEVTKDYELVELEERSGYSKGFSEGMTQVHYKGKAFHKGDRSVIDMLLEWKKDAESDTSRQMLPSLSTQESDRLFNQFGSEIVVVHDMDIEGKWAPEDADSGRYYGYDEFRVEMTANDALNSISQIILSDEFYEYVQNTEDENTDDSQYEDSQDYRNWVWELINPLNPWYDKIVKASDSGYRADFLNFDDGSGDSRIKYKDGYLKAPNGKPTNLTERQWLQVRTQNFKDWFGDWENDPKNASKVVDENGEPMVVYHGTNNVEAISKEGVIRIPKTDKDVVNGAAFGKAVYFGKYAEHGEVSQFSQNGGVFPAFISGKTLDIQSLTEADKKALSKLGKYMRSKTDWLFIEPKRKTKSFADKESARMFYRERKSIWDAMADNYDRYMPTMDTDGQNFVVVYSDYDTATIENEGSAYELLSKVGFDKIKEIGYDVFMDTTQNHVVVYSDNKIKSATGNVGTFSESSDIRYQIDNAIQSASPDMQDRIAKIMEKQKKVQQAANATYRELTTKIGRTTSVYEWDSLMRKSLVTAIRNAFPGAAPMNIEKYAALEETLGELDPGLEDHAKEIKRIKAQLRRMVAMDKKFRAALEDVSGFSDIADIPFEGLFSALENTNPAAYDRYFKDETFDILLKALPKIKTAYDGQFTMQTLQRIVDVILSGNDPNVGRDVSELAFLQPQRLFAELFGKAGINTINYAYHGTLKLAAYEMEYTPHLREINRLLMTADNNRGSAYDGDDLDIIGRTIFEVDGNSEISNKLETIQERLAEWAEENNAVINSKDVEEIYNEKEYLKDIMRGFIAEWNANPERTQKIGIREDYDNPRNYNWGDISDITTKGGKYLYTPGNARERSKQDFSDGLDYDTNIFNAYSNYMYSMTRYMAFYDLANYVEGSSILYASKGGKAGQKKMASGFDLDLSLAQHKSSAYASKMIEDYVRNTIGYHKKDTPKGRLLASARTNVYASLLAANVIMTVLNYNQRNLIHSVVDQNIAMQVRTDVAFWTGLFKPSNEEYPTLSGIMQAYVTANQSLVAELAAEAKRSANQGRTALTRAYYKHSAYNAEMLRLSPFSLAELGNRAYAHAAGVYQVTQNSMAYKEYVASGMSRHQAMERALSEDSNLRRAAITYGGIINAEINADANRAFSPHFFGDASKIKKVAIFLRYGVTIALLELRTYGGARDIKSLLSPDLFRLLTSGNVKAATAAQTIQAGAIMKSMLHPKRIAELVRKGQVSTAETSKNLITVNEVNMVRDAITWALYEQAKHTEGEFHNIIRGKSGAKQAMAALMAFSVSEVLLRSLLELLFSLIPWWQGKKKFIETDVIENIASVLGLFQGLKTASNVRLGSTLAPDLGAYNPTAKTTTKALSQYVLRLTPYAGFANYMGKVFTGKYFSDLFWDEVYD